MITRLTAVAVVLLTTACANTTRETAPISSTTPVTSVACSEIDYAPAVTDQFPEIASACRGVIRDAEGTPYVEVDAVVLNVRKNLRDQSVSRVTLDLLSANDQSLRKLSTRPPKDLSFSVDGRQTAVGDMARGQNLRIYLPADRWEVGHHNGDTGGHHGVHRRCGDLPGYNQLRSGRSLRVRQRRAERHRAS